MNERKKVIRSDNTRQRQHEKLKAALAKKPTASSLNAANIFPHHMKEPEQISEEKQKFFKERLVKNAKNKKRYSNINSGRRHHVIAGPENNRSYMEVSSSHDGLSKELITPDWFRTKEPVDVSIIIPMYKSDAVIADMIHTWPIENYGFKVEMIFVDDQCPKRSKEAVLNAWSLRKDTLIAPIGKIIFNTSNKGYGQACNAGVAYATGKYLIFLNADTKVTPGWIKPMIDLFQDSQVGLVGNLHLKEGGGYDGTIDSAGSEWRWGDMSFVHIGRHSYKKQGIGQPFKLDNCPKDLLEVSEREMVTGCCFAMPKNLFNYIGGFNPNYKIGYWEDSEICLNVKELGYKILFQPNSIIYHKLGHTSSGGHKYFGHNKQYFMNKWVKSHRLDSLLLSEGRSNPDEVKNILIRRSNATGDSLVAAGVCAGLKKKYPWAKIMFSTLHPEVIEGNSYIDEFVEIKNIHSTRFDLFYNLDYCYEWRPHVNILTSYAEAVGVKKEDCRLTLKRQEIHETLPDNYIVIHPGKTNWVGRDWPTEHFAEISRRLMQEGENIVVVGKHSEDSIPCNINLKGKTNIAQLANVMSRAKACITIDSMPMHVAQAFDIPGIAFFGCIKPESRIYSKKMRGITAQNLPCLGCHHRKPPPSTVTKNCETGTLNCIHNVTVDDMWHKVKEMLEEIKSERISLLG